MTCAVCGDPVEVLELIDGTSTVLHHSPRPGRPAHHARLPLVTGLPL